MSRQKRRTEIGESFISYPRSMLESPAFMSLSPTAMRVLHRIEIEHMNHGGAENGRLQVRFEDFERYRIDRKGIQPAIRELTALGFLEVTEPGHAGAAGFGKANRFRLTYVNCKSREQPTHEWRRIETVEMAETTVSAAKRKKSQRARDLGRRSWAARKENFSSKNRTESVPKTEPKSARFSSQSGTTRFSSQSGTTVYNLGGEARAAPDHLHCSPTSPSDHFLQARLLAAPCKSPNDFAKNGDV
jgi:hypothetical protein